MRAGISETAPTPRLCISFGTDSRTVVASKVQDETVVYRFWLNVFDSDKQVRVTVAKHDVSQLDSAEQTIGQNVRGDKRYGNDNGLHVDSMVVHGPVAVDGQNLSSLHKTFFTKLPANDSERISFGQEIVQRFASAAFRRLVEEQEIERLMHLLKVAVVQGESFESAVQIALTAILVSPQFLFLVKPEPAE